MNLLAFAAALASAAVPGLGADLFGKKAEEDARPKTAKEKEDDARYLAKAEEKRQRKAQKLRERGRLC